jgi:DNA-binding response OmpR family regulator
VSKSEPYILIVEDDRSVADVLRAVMRRSGYQASLAYNGDEATAAIRQRSFDVAILDLNLGRDDLNGIELLALLREQSPRTAVIMLTGYATLDSAIAAVRLGAHDYLLKPSSMAEIRRSVEQALQQQSQASQREQILSQLEARLSHTLLDVRQALSGGGIAASALPDGRFIERGPVIIDLNRQVALVNGSALDLTLIEYSLLTYLISAAPRLVAPQELVSQIHGHASEVDEASALIRPHISRLRRKLRQVGAGEFVRTIRGRGYAVD